MENDKDIQKILEGKKILITGGTGYLGKALLDELLKYNPASIRLFSRDEVKHHKIQELYNNHPKIRSLIGDVRDYQRLLKATRQVDIVIHAAALKRLDLLEYNVEESIKTNILGSLNVVNACLTNRVNKAIMVSTDKACSPVNTYGACKFVSERIFSETNYNKGDINTVFTTVRYGNVLESTGSVIPFFSSKINSGEEIPLTHPEMTRFIITPQQAVELIFGAIKYGIGGEVFIPQLPSFKITDLIEILKEKYNRQNNVKNIGVRPGEKIHEIMINESEILRTYNYKNYYIVESSIQKYKKNKSGPAEYIKNGTKIKEKSMKEYSSKNALITQEEVKNLFKKLKII